MVARAIRCGAALAVTLVTIAGPSAAWSLSREAVRPALLAGRDEARRCAREHAAPNGRYAFWIAVDPEGRARVQLKEHPPGVSPEAHRCLTAAYERPTYPTALEATVAWSAASPPRPTYTIALPIEIAVNAYGFQPLATARLRPSPARSRWLAKR